MNMQNFMIFLNNYKKLISIIIKITNLKSMKLKLYQAMMIAMNGKIVIVKMMNKIKKKNLEVK